MSARVALLVTALALACAGCERGECNDHLPINGGCNPGWTTLAIVQRGMSAVAVCACPGSPLLDGGR